MLFVLSSVVLLAGILLYPKTSLIYYNWTNLLTLLLFFFCTTFFRRDNEKMSRQDIVALMRHGHVTCEIYSPVTVTTKTSTLLYCLGTLRSLLILVIEREEREREETQMKLCQQNMRVGCDLDKKHCFEIDKRTRSERRKDTSRLRCV